MRNRQSANLTYYSRNEDSRVSIDRVNSAAHTPRKSRVGPSARSTINHLVTVWFGYFPATGAGGSKIVPVPSILYGEVDCQSSLFRQLRPELDRMRANSGVWNAISTAGQFRKGCPCVEALCGNQLHRVRASVRKQQSVCLLHRCVREQSYRLVRVQSEYSSLQQVMLAVILVLVVGTG